MDFLKIEEHELLWFFEIEPEKVEADEYWFLTTSIYLVTRDDLSLSFAIHPHHRDIGIVLLKGDQKILDISATNIKTISAKKVDSKGKGWAGEILDIQVSDTQRITLQIKPEIFIQQETCDLS